MKKPFLPCNKNLKAFSRDLRNFSSFSEILLWNELKAGKMLGYKFNGQKPLGNYIVDFYCKKLSLVIEVDGVSHESEEAIQKDLIRQREFEALGLTFLRFRDLDVKRDILGVLNTIEKFIRESSNPPNPLFKGGTENVGRE